MAVHNVRALALSQWALSESDGGHFVGPGQGPLQGTIRQLPVPAREVQMLTMRAGTCLLNQFRMYAPTASALYRAILLVELAWRHICGGDSATYTQKAS